LISRGQAPIGTDSILIANVGELLIYNTSYTGVQPHFINFGECDYSTERGKAINKSNSDGVFPMSKEEQDFERSVSWSMVKQFTKKIFTMDWTHFSFPVAYSEPRSFLERTADLFTFLSNKYAYEAAASSDPNERLINITIGIIAGFYIYMQSKKPWNPMLGETYVAEWQNGTKIYGEQTSHHPPVSNFEIFSHDGSWKCHAQCNFVISSGMTEVNVFQKGKFTMVFHDGDQYEWEFPDICVRGILMGERVVRVQGKVKVFNPTHNLVAITKIAPKKDKKKGINSFSHTNIYGGIQKIGDPKYAYSTIIKGNYCQSIIVNDKIVWDINNDIAQRPKQDIDRDFLLNSDCRFRLDRAFLIENNTIYAEESKVVMEESQRREEKMRKVSK